MEVGKHDVVNFNFTRPHVGTLFGASHRRSPPTLSGRYNDQNTRLAHAEVRAISG